MNGTLRKIKLGYGFVAGEDGIDYFFHWSNFSKLTKQLRYCQEGEAITFEPLVSERGPRATDIKVVGHTLREVSTPTTLTGIALAGGTNTADNQYIPTKTLGLTSK